MLKNLTYTTLFLLMLNGFAQNQPPLIEAESNAAYCPLSQMPIVENFSITDPDDTEIEAFYIQISAGYQNGADELILTGNHPNIEASWDAIQGKLTLTGTGGINMLYTDLINAIQDVVFENSTTNITPEKSLSFTIGDANYLPSTGHYYQYVSDVGITWTNAKTQAENSTYYGLQGYLATITSADEAQLSGEQAEGAGWLGGSDAETEGEWKWVTGPENGTVFWNGGINGSTSNYANWNNQEPNNCCGGEDYLHVTFNVGPPGTWNDLPDAGSTGNYYPQGYIVEYGGMPGDPVVNLSASTTILTPQIVTATDASNCGSGSVALQATASVGDVLWFDDENGTTPIFIGDTFNTPVISETTTYYALASYDSCLEGEKITVTATIYPLPETASSITFKNCDEDGAADGFTDFNLTEINALIADSTNDYVFSYHLSESDAENNADAIALLSFNNATANTVYARVEGEVGCFEVVEIHLEVSTTSFSDGFLLTLEDCDDNTDGFLEFDLSALEQDFLDQFPAGQNLSVHYYPTLEDAQLEQDEITNTSNYTNQNPFNETLFVRVESDDNGTCFGIGPHLQLTVNPQPKFEVNIVDVFCSGGNPITLQVENPNGNYSYEWTDSNGAVISSISSVLAEAGAYTVTATSDMGCISEETVTVIASSIAEITSEDISVVDTSNNNSITITTENLGVGDYEFALETESGISTYQDSPILNNVPAGEHILHVRDKNGCGITEIGVFVLGFSKFFTPNNDSYNDFWNLKGLGSNYTQQSAVYIFDRYGKLIQTINPLDGGWNGTLNGVPLPVSDYWFRAKLVKLNGEVRVLQGHFSLLR